MESGNKWVLRSAVAACFGLLGGDALAVLNMSVSPITGVTKFAKEIPTNTTTLVNAANQLDIKVAVPQNYAVSQSSPLFVKIVLTNGAKFTTNPTSFRCGTAAAANSMSGVLTLGGAGSNFVTYQVEVGTVSGTCSATDGNFTISGLNDVAVSATVEYANGLTTVVSGLATPFITYVRAMTATVSSNDGVLTVDATSGSDNWATTSTLASITLGKLGVIRYTQGFASSAVSAGAANNVSAADVITTASVTISGPAIGVAAANLGNSGVFLDKTDATCATKDYLVAASGSNSVTFFVTPADINAGVTACISVSGNATVIPTGQISASIASATPIANVTADFTGSSGSNLVNIGQNGTTKTAWLVNASTSPAKTSVLRIMNNGAADAAFTATARQIDAGVADGNPAAGTTLGTANAALGTVVAGGALTLTSAQLESKLGFTPGATTAKYRVTISAGTTDFQVLNFTRDVARGSIVLSQPVQ